MTQDWRHRLAPRVDASPMWFAAGPRVPARLRPTRGGARSRGGSLPPAGAGAAARSPQTMATTPTDHDVADLGLAEAGQARIEWADAQMPVLASIRERFQ